MVPHFAEKECEKREVRMMKLTCMQVLWKGGLHRLL